VLVLVLCLLWLEASRRGARSTFSNKVAAEDLSTQCRIQDFEALLVGHGGEGENGGFLVMQAPLLLAGLSGEGEKGCGASHCAPPTTSMLVDGYRRWGILLLCLTMVVRSKTLKLKPP
jgi:hypothetical protein